jgi:hypothetical protein
MSEVLDTLKDFFSGCVSGWVQVLVMQPFEIVKVRLINQSLHNPEYHGIIDCFRKIYREEGATTFYKGTLLVYFRYLIAIAGYRCSSIIAIRIELVDKKTAV